MTEHRSPKVRIEQILNAARHCFIQKGYAATKVLDIAEVAGLSKGGIYFHFPSKRDIFRGLVEREYNLAMSYLDGVMADHIPLLSKIRLIGEHFVKTFSDLDQSRFMITIGEMSLRDEEVAKMLQGLQRHYFDRISELLQHAQEHGELHPIDTEATAIVLKALIDGIQLNFALGIEIDQAKLVESGMILLTQGLIPSEES